LRTCKRSLIRRTTKAVIRNNGGFNQRTNDYIFICWISKKNWVGDFNNLSVWNLDFNYSLGNLWHSKL
jgi:hypothetical protein